MRVFVYNYLNYVLWFFFYPFYPTTLLLFGCSIYYRTRKHINGPTPFALCPASYIPTAAALPHYTLEKIYLPFEGGRVYVTMHFGIGVVLNALSAVLLLWPKRNPQHVRNEVP